MIAFVGLCIVAAVAVGLAIGHSTGSVTKVDVNTIYLLLVACVALVFPQLKTLSFNKDGLSFEKFEKRLERIDAKVEDVRQGAAELGTAVARGVGGGKSGAAETTTEARVEGHATQAEAGGTESVPTDAADPQAGRWGGKSSGNDRRLTARVTPSRLRDDWFKVELTVESTNPERPLANSVTFHLHPSFYRSASVRPVERDGRARLELLAWGAFTVGAEADGGATQLELNLADAPGVPPAFVAAS
jgi:hypothetical protein